MMSKSNFSGYSKIEFWAVTTIFVFTMFFFITDTLGDESFFDSAPSRPTFEAAGVGFDYYDNFFLPRLGQVIYMYLAFLYLNFLLVPKIIRKEQLGKNTLLLIGVGLLTTLVFSVTNAHMKEYLYFQYSEERANVKIFIQALVLAGKLTYMFVIYTAAKYTGLYLLSRSVQMEKRYRFIRREAIIAFIIWMMLMVMLAIVNADWIVIAMALIFFPSGILLYLYSFYRLIPKANKNRFPFLSYILRCIGLLALAFFPVSIILMLVQLDMDDLGFNLSLFNTIFHFFITVPVTWWLYKRHAKGNEEINVLQKELKQSSANIDFLRSQINPHFLFNALNTIYGTALQENAERTGEAVQKLGDMMRFMLQENMQDKISLSREIDYLNNYISLQKLRTTTTPDIRIEEKIYEGNTLFQIAPMLLIPFVENAFKHGISFREQSEIKISLDVKDSTLYFDVHNSKHPKPDSDPEKDKSGIGLENVRQRLNLEYPDKHNLLIHETDKDFYVHLTIQLN